MNRVGTLKYTPSGVAVRDCQLAVNQNAFGKESVGYFDLILFADIAEKPTPVLKVGAALDVEGTLWSRTYRNRKGAKVTEVKVIVETFAAAAKPS